MTSADGFFPPPPPPSSAASDADRIDERPDSHGVTLALRSNVSLHNLFPDHDPGRLPLATSGSYLIAVLDGDVALEGPLAPQALTVWRAGVAPGPASLRHGPGALAMALHFPESWYRSCPRGPGCQVGEFLMRGGEPPVPQQPLELDPDGEAIVRRLMRASLQNDADLLTVERDMLALLSWAFHQHGANIAAAHAEDTVPARHLARLKQARELLCRRQSHPPTVPELAQLVGLNEFDLKRHFKAYYGSSVAHYSRQQRLRSARNLLELSARSVADVALDVGFQNPSQFARAFRRQFGINPAEHRRAGH